MTFENIKKEVHHLNVMWLSFPGNQVFIIIVYRLAVINGSTSFKNVQDFVLKDDILIS